MHSSIIKKTLIFSLICLCITAVCTSLTWLFLYLCKAEGEILVLLIWTAVSSVLIYCVYAINKEKIKSKLVLVIYRVVKIIALLITGLGAVVVLLQLGATQRSFAEAWFEYTRTDGPFGFFSFFAGEIYAFLLLISVFSFAKKKYLGGVCIILAVTSLCAGIILGKQLFLLLTASLVLIPFIKQKRWQNLIVPFIATAIIASCISLVEVSKKNDFLSHFYIDTSVIVSRIAPDFPLLSSVPGYGYSVGTVEMERSVNLTTHRVFQVSGTPNQTVYLTTSKSAFWNGQNWTKSYRQDTEKEVQLVYENDIIDFSSNPVKSVITVQMLEDFYTLIPCTHETFGVRFPEIFRDGIVIEDMSKVLSINKVIPKDTKFVLYQTNVPYLTNEDLELDETLKANEESVMSLYQDSLKYAKIPPKIDALAYSIMKQAQLSATDENTVKRHYIQLILDYLSTDFTYSLKTPYGFTNEDPFDYFVFNSKTGFCTWFAGAFTLFMQAQQIPCRIAEGFRVTLNEQGQGIVTGIQAHAWPEVYIDGGWRVFEPTPVYHSDNPFSYVQEDDKRTIKQLSRLFNEDEVIEAEIPNNSFYDFVISKLLPICLILVAVILVVLVVITVYRLYAKTYHIYKLRRIVKQYKKRGVSLPSEIGWLLWKEKVNDISETTIEKQKSMVACKLADEMIAKVYKV